MARTKLGLEHPAAIELASLLHAARHLPARLEADTKRIAEGRVECASIQRRLLELPQRFTDAAAAVDESLAVLAGTPGDPASFAPLDELLEAQAYRLCFWRVASDEINYRRFFDINDLAALTTEREDVFLAIHRTWLGWVATGLADGLRIDHPDGLFDPKQYLERLQERYRVLVPGRNEPLYVVVEKILGDGEALPADWICDGTTGYEFIHAVNGLLIDQNGEGPLTAFYHQFTGLDEAWPEVVYRCKREVSQGTLTSELNALAYQLDRLARLDRRSRDFTLNSIRKALREVVASFPVYRSYVDGSVHDSDKSVVGKATRWAYRRNPLLGRAIFDFIRDTVLLKDSPSGPATEEYRALQRAFAGKFQQVTSPVAAKGVEDTAFYVFNRLVSLNEVGGEPGRFGWKPEAVHEFFRTRSEMPRRAFAALHPRHQAWRGRAGPHPCALRNAGRMGRACDSMGRTQSPAQDRGGRNARARCQRGIPPLPDSRGAWPEKVDVEFVAHSAVHEEGARGGQGPHQLDQPGRRV